MGRAMYYCPLELILLVRVFYPGGLQIVSPFFILPSNLVKRSYMDAVGAGHYGTTVLFLIRANGGKEFFCPTPEGASRRKSSGVAALDHMN